MARPHRVRPMSALFALASMFLLASTAGCPLGRGSKGYGEACEHNNNCADARCAPVGKFCTKSCAADADCGAGRACVAKVCEAPPKAP